MEKAHDISLDEPCVAHQAILFMLDVLMRNNKPTLTLEELYDSFGDKSFTPQMLRAVGGNEQGLKQFLLRYPSLFTANGDLISANSGGSQLPRVSTTPDRYLRKTKSLVKTSDPNDSGSSTDLINSSSSSSSSTPSGQCTEPAPDSKTMKEIEQEAIAFFRKQISKREEDWLPVVSVAGHASQSSSDIRKFVGPQNEFKDFLKKYPHIFIVRDEYCGLKGRADVSATPFPPPSPPPKRRVPTSISINNGVLTRAHSFKQSNRYSACGNLMPNTPTSLTTSLLNNTQAQMINSGLNTQNSNLIQSSPVCNPVNQAKPRLTPVEVKAVHYVMRILHKNGRMLLQTIPGLISRAPEQVSNIVGFTREDLIQFFKRHSAIFQLHPDGCVSVKQDAVKALILKDATNAASLMNGNHNLIGQENPGIITNSGVILRIFPKYGILNMDNNEQVFFDIQSCQFETFSDLTTILHTGDRLYFNAIIGPRDGSTKWRSLKTWIKMKPQQSSSSNNVMGILDNMSSHSDADKSDDSSTTSSHGAGSGSGYPSARQHHQHHSFTNGFNFNQNQMFNQQQNSNGNYYMINNGSSLPPTSTSPNSINNSTDDNNNNNSNEIKVNGSVSLINSASSGSGDFNQYQLDSGDFQNQTQNSSNGAIDESVGESTVSSSGHLIHSSSASNLAGNGNSNQMSSNENQMGKVGSLSSSKSIHSFNLVSFSDQNDSKSKCQEDGNNSNKNVITTKFMKQSPDNISKKEVSTKDNGAELMSIGCQTISTGDITVTNVYIE